MSIASPALRTRLSAPLIERIRGHFAGLCLLGRGIPAASGLPVSSEEAERRERRALAAYEAVIADGSDVKQWAVRQCVVVGAASSDSPATPAVSSLLECLDCLRASTPPAEKRLEDYGIACPSGCGAIMRRREFAALTACPSIPCHELMREDGPEHEHGPEPAVVFSLAELQAGLPDGVDSTRKEAYLSNAEFLIAFDGISRADFEQAPAWRRAQWKKTSGLF